MNPVFYLIVFLIAIIAFISLIPICSKLVDLTKAISNKIFKDNEEDK
ncbi:hypothetical protein [Clostridium botulinum]|nr:hypothetical protein [Clostridium botulinum]APR02548.1 hypothetical protein RSJ2_3993 [Clostridium botulinum]MBD5589299.1 hypothetical protein [Clostridium botulinum]MBY6842648.1 hypothetical protein [Clostridium botulinum]